MHIPDNRVQRLFGRALHDRAFERSGPAAVYLMARSSWAADNYVL